MAASRRALAVEQQVKVIRDSDRALHQEAGAGFRQIARRAIDFRSEMMERDRTALKHTVAGGPAFVRRQLIHSASL